MRLHYKDGDEFLFSVEPLFLGRRCGASGGGGEGPSSSGQNAPRPTDPLCRFGLDLDRGEREKRVWKYGSSTMTAG